MTIRDGNRRTHDLGPCEAHMPASTGGVMATEGKRVITDVTNYNKDFLTPEEARERARAWNKSGPRALQLRAAARRYRERRREAA